MSVALPIELASDADGSPGPSHWVSGWPELVAEWHPTRNGTLRPDQVTRGSGQKVWWKCAHGRDHEWRATPNNRTTGRTGCPHCAGRKVSVTNSLAALRPDLAKQWHPTRNGALTTGRIVAGSTRRVWWRCPVAPDHEWRVSPHDRANGDGGCPFCTGHRVCATNSLAAIRPQLAAEWHPTKNGKSAPRDVVPGSSLVVWWCCSREGHEWRAAISNRTRGSGCPFCAGRKPSARHCLAEAYPEIAAEWHKTRNGLLTARSVTPRARRRVWWCCSEGHDWRAPVVDRSRRGVGCPVCSRQARKRRAKPARSCPCQPGPTSASGYLVEQHRRIEQVLALLAHGTGGDDEFLARAIADVSAHLTAEETLLYPLVERAWGRRLDEQRELHERMRLLLSRLVVRSDEASVRKDVNALEAAFREHSHRVEGTALPWIETAGRRDSFEALRMRLQELRASTRAPAGRERRTRHGAR